MNVKPKIAVLFAAYNGCNWLFEQIDSILNQRDVKVTIFISVDVSTDSTYDACIDLSHKYDNIFILPYGDRFGGAAKNFLRLFVDVDFSSYDFVSLADQDDIWLPTKLVTAVQTMKKRSYDAYSSNVTAFWPDGRTCLIDKAYAQVDYDFFFEPAGPGCTYVLTNQLASEFKTFAKMNYEKAGEIIFHDWLIYSFARFNNFKWFIDKTPSMLYRQHANNQVGANASLSAYVKRLKMVISKWYSGEVLKIIDVLSAGNHPFISKYFSGNNINLWGLALNSFKCRRRLRDKFVFLFICLFRIF